MWQPLALAQVMVASLKSVTSFQSVLVTQVPFSWTRRSDATEMWVTFSRALILPMRPMIWKVALLIMSVSFGLTFRWVVQRQAVLGR